MTKFTSSLPIVIYSRPAGSNELWQEFDRGPGIFQIPDGIEINIRIQNIDDQVLVVLAAEIENVPELAFLNLSENRKITDTGLPSLGRLKQLKGLNLSSCSITGPGLTALSTLAELLHLDLSYCARVADPGLRVVKSLHNLAFLDLQGCVKITRAGMSKIERHGLVIHYK